MIREHMKKAIDYEEIKRIHNEYNERWKLFLESGVSANPVLEKLIAAFNQYLSVDKYNTEVRFEYAIFLYNPPMADPYEAIDQLNIIFAYDPDNIFALLLMVYFKDFSLGGMGDELFLKLCNVSTHDKDVLAMVELAKAWYYQWEHEDKYEPALKNSINYCPTHVSNYIYLAEVYCKQNKLSQAYNLLNTAIGNVKIVLNTKDSSKHDLTTLQNFLDERFRGTRKTDILYESYLRDRDKIKEILKNNP